MPEQQCSELCINKQNEKHNKAMLQYITNTDVELPVVEQVKAVLAGGCRWIQVRMKEASDEEITRVVEEIKPLCLEHEAFLLLNDRVELAKTLDVGCVHLGHDDMPASQARMKLGPAAVIGVTANTFADILAVSALDIDYFGVGPYRMTTTKKNLSPVLGVEGIKEIVEKMRNACAKAKAAALKNGDVMLLENTRFEKGETKNDPELSKALASLADVFVNDAFGTAHRAHSSTAGVADYLPAVSGFLVQKEVSIMGKALSDPERPFVAVLGGAKVSDKLNVINNLLEKVDTLIIGGGMAYTFLAAKGYAVGKSLLDESKIDYCKDMMAKAEAKGVKLLLPVDVVVADSFPDPIDGPIDVTTVDAAAIPADKEGLDIGEKTCALFASAVKDAKTVVWNGPMGVFENPTLAKGTIAMAQALADSSATTIVGGGDSAAACEQLGFADKITHISTGGGASLEFLEGKELPGVAAADDK